MPEPDDPAMEPKVAPPEEAKTLKPPPAGLVGSVEELSGDENVEEPPNTGLWDAILGGEPNVGPPPKEGLPPKVAAPPKPWGVCGEVTAKPVLATGPLPPLKLPVPALPLVLLPPKMLL